VATLGSQTPVALAHADAMVPGLLELTAEVRPAPLSRPATCTRTRAHCAGTCVIAQFEWDRSQMPEWAAECCRTRLSRWEPQLRQALDERAQWGKGTSRRTQPTQRRRAPRLSFDWDALSVCLVRARSRLLRVQR
jgi:hypothetical protein